MFSIGDTVIVEINGKKWKGRVWQDRNEHGKIGVRVGPEGPRSTYFFAEEWQLTRVRVEVK